MNKYFLLITNLLFIDCKPNIVLIIADDYGWGDVGLHGSSQVKTPNIDVLASNGIILNNYYVSPICSPSRGALLTGRHPIHTGTQHDVFAAENDDGLPLQFKILPQYLRQMGYDTHAVGKWHQGFFKRDYIPTQRGFDSHFGYWTAGADYYDRSSRETWWGIDFRDNERPIPVDEYQGLYSTHIYTNKSVDIILNQRTNSSKPLFLYLAHQSVHSGSGRQPLQAPQDLIDSFGHIDDIKRRTFAAMVSTLDESVGQVVEALQKADILNNTIIIFTTDNGAAIAAPPNFEGWNDHSMGSNWPLRGSKYTLFEGGIRGFSFLWSPLLKQQYISHHLMHITDWLPTIYSAVGGQSQDLGDIDGLDMWDVLNNNGSNRRQHLLHNIDDIWGFWSLRNGNYKLMSGSPEEGIYDHWFLPPGETDQTDLKHFKSMHKEYEQCLVSQMLRQMNFTQRPVQPILVNCDPTLKGKCRPLEKPCLFDVISDPCEYNNLYEEKPQIVETMLKFLEQYNSTAVHPINGKMNPLANPVFHNYRWDIWQ